MPALWSQENARILNVRLINSLILISLLASCSAKRQSLSPSANLDPDIDPVTGGAWYQPTVAATWQLQLTGTLNTTHVVDVYDIDLFDNSSSAIAALQGSGKKVICYFSTSYEDWRSDAADFLSTSLGNNMDDWPGERWVDIRSQNVLDIMLARLDLAVTKGCDGVDPDNVNSYENDTGFSLTATDQLAFNRRIANEAHNRNLTIGLKNDGSQSAELVDYFDFELNEECHQYGECDDLDIFITNSKPVFNVEYTLTDAICPTALAENFRTIFLPKLLDGSSRDSCD